MFCSPVKPSLYNQENENSIRKTCLCASCAQSTDYTSKNVNNYNLLPAFSIVIAQFGKIICTNTNSNWLNWHTTDCVCFASERNQNMLENLNNFRSACGIHSKTTAPQKSSFIKYSNLLKKLSHTRSHGIVFSARCRVFEESDHTTARHLACLNFRHAIGVRKCYRITLKTNKRMNEQAHRTEPNQTKLNQIETKKVQFNTHDSIE